MTEFVQTTQDALAAIAHSQTTQTVLLVVIAVMMFWALVCLVYIFMNTRSLR